MLFFLQIPPVFFKPSSHLSKILSGSGEKPTAKTKQKEREKKTNESIYFVYPQKQTYSMGSRENSWRIWLERISIVAGVITIIISGNNHHIWKGLFSLAAGVVA